MIIVNLKLIPTWSLNRALKIIKINVKGGVPRWSSEWSLTNGAERQMHIFSLDFQFVLLLLECQKVSRIDLEIECKLVSESS